MAFSQRIQAGVGFHRKSSWIEFSAGSTLRQEPEANGSRVDQDMIDGLAIRVCRGANSHGSKESVDIITRRAGIDHDGQLIIDGIHYRNGCLTRRTWILLRGRGDRVIPCVWAAKYTGYRIDCGTSSRPT